VFVKTDQGAIDSVSVDNCLLLGYTGYATYDRSGSYGLPTNVAFTNNVFGLRVGQAPAGEGWSTGRLSSTNPGPTWTGNTDVNGVPV
jgi:hypothetical protein